MRFAAPHDNRATCSPTDQHTFVCLSVAVRGMQKSLVNDDTRNCWKILTRLFKRLSFNFEYFVLLGPVIVS